MSSNENLIDSIIGNEKILNLKLKLIFGLLNIIFNSLIIRSINLNVFVISNIRLELVYFTILFLTRESLRDNIPKSNKIYSISHYINLIWLTLSSGLVFIFILSLLSFFLPIHQNEPVLPYYTTSFFLYVLSALIELLSEPLYLLISITKHHSINIYIEFITSIIGIK